MPERGVQDSTTADLAELSLKHHTAAAFEAPLGTSGSPPYLCRQEYPTC